VKAQFSLAYFFSVMHGDEAIRRIREMGFVQVPIIALTGNAFEEERQKLMQAGATLFLSKPSTAIQLKVAIQECLGMKLSQIHSVA
jgi:CheY-like chemotaxis protein